MVVARVGGVEKMGRWSKGTDFSPKVNKFWGPNVQHADCNLKYCLIHWKVLKGVDLKSYHHTPPTHTLTQVIM